MDLVNSRSIIAILKILVISQLMVSCQSGARAAAASALLESKAPDEPLRAWVVGCSSGEDAYTLAMVLYQVLDRQESNIPVQLFATDLYDLSLQEARSGYFPGKLHQDMSQEWLNHFFFKEGEG